MWGVGSGKFPNKNLIRQKSTTLSLNQPKKKKYTYIYFYNAHHIQLLRDFFKHAVSVGHRMSILLALPGVTSSRLPNGQRPVRATTGSFPKAHSLHILLNRTEPRKKNKLQNAEISKWLAHTRHIFIKGMCNSHRISREQKIQ